MHLLGVDIWGGYAELVCIPATNTRLIPEGVSFEQATVIARHGPTALNLIENCGRLAAGETVLVMGASGGIGSMAIQISKLMEANVIAAAGRDSSLEAVVELGADAAINYSKEDITEQVERFTDGKGVDVVCENVGDPKLWPQAFQSLAVGGRLVTAGAHAGGMVQVDLKRLYFRRLQIIGDGSEAPDGFERSLSWASKGKVKGLVDRVMHFDDAPEAHRAVAERSTVGKILLTPQSKSNHLSAELS
jgi:NADPH:quinone reductase-like Zn-dependent oxidoreductase